MGERATKKTSQLLMKKEDEDEWLISHEPNKYFMSGQQGSQREALRAPVPAIQ